MNHKKPGLKHFIFSHNLSCFNHYHRNEIRAGHDQWTDLPFSPGMEVFDLYGEKAGKYCVILLSIEKVDTRDRILLFVF